jgi:hypothetical protein
LRGEEQEVRKKEEERRAASDTADAEMVRRRREYEASDAARLSKLEADLAARKAAREKEEVDRRQALSRLAFQAEEAAAAEQAALRAAEAKAAAAGVGDTAGDLADMFSALEEENNEVRRLGVLKLEEFENVKQQMRGEEEKRQQALMSLQQQQEAAVQDTSARLVQRVFRGKRGRDKAREIREAEAEAMEMEMAAMRVQAVIRGHIGRESARKRKFMLQRERAELKGASTLQRVFRRVVCVCVCQLVVCC